MVLTVVKVAKKIDAIITRIGLNPAITGDSLGRSFPGVLTYTVARTVASRVVQTAGKNTAAGKTSVQTQTKSGSKPGSKPTSSGRYYGGVNTVNTFADSRRSEQQSGNSPRQAEPRASGTEPAAQPASAAADRSFVMPGTRRPVNHVPSEHKIAPSDTAGKAGHTVSRSSHVQAGGQQHTASAAQQHTATSAFERRYSRNTGPARSTVAGRIARPAPASANAPTKAPRSSTIPQERSAARTTSCPQVSAAGVRPDTAGMSHSTRRPTVSPTKNTQGTPKQTPHIPTQVKKPTVSGQRCPERTPRAANAAVRRRKTAMQDNQRQHSGIDMARRIVSAARIAKAAAAGGVHGAAVAAAKEAAPFLAKLAIWVLVALIVLPMLIFAYLPNIFFGFSSSGTASVARMTGQAMTLGGFYMDLEDFENTQIDAIVTSLIQQYEEEGIEIDGVEINSDFDEDDLRRFIAISSVAYQQDLEVMTTEAVLSLVTSRLRYEPTLNIFEFGGLLKRMLVIQN